MKTHQRTKETRRNDMGLREHELGIVAELPLAKLNRPVVLMYCWVHSSIFMFRLFGRFLSP